MAIETSDSAYDEPVAYIFSSEFDDADHGQMTQLSDGSSIYADRESEGTIDVGGSGDFDTLRDLPLLSPTGEAFLFRKMNFQKHRAEQARTALAAGDRSEENQFDFEDFLEDAETLRNHIAECNLRLVISIARKFATSTCDFDELMSEGNEILLKAITKFDYSRGYRFSTYATHSVQRHFYRYTQRKHKRDSVEYRSSVELLNELPQADADELIQQWVQEEERMSALIAQMADRLDEREHRIVTARFGLSTSGVTKTLRELSAELGLSKERVRQLQMAAVEKLRDLFDDLDVEFSAT
ncbi:MAG: sigma-70 family RNA polymerase sigma factor [Fuerstiella sp.]